MSEALLARRPLHPMERAWLVAERLLPGFAFGLRVEGEGTLDPDAVERALPQHPGMAGRVVGSLGWSAVVMDRPPRVARAEGRLDPWEGPAAEIVLEPGAISFRVHHALADGRAAHRWAEDTFAALRGEPVQPVGTLLPPPATRGPAPPLDQPSLFGPPDPQAPWGCHRAHLRVQTSPRGALRRVLRAIWARREGARISVPVDLRPPGQPSGGNLTGIAQLTHEGELESLRARAADVFSRAEGLRWLPLSLLSWGARRAALQSLRADRFDAVATVSNLGRMDLGRLSCPGFQARRAWWIPPENMGNPLLILISGDDEGLDLSAVAPRAVVSEDGLRAFLGELGEGLRRG